MKWVAISNDPSPLSDEHGPCWNWIGYLDRNGYGRTSYNGKRGSLVHRVLFSLIIGAIPDGLTLDHLCRNRGCVNPSHLEPVSMKENLLRGFSPFAIHKRKTHCKRGHEFSGENLHILPNGGRECLLCRKIKNDLGYQRRKQLKQNMMASP